MKAGKYVFLILLLSACSHLQRSEGVAHDDIDVLSPVDGSVPAAENDLTDTPGIEGVPHEFNAQVQKWLDYFTGRGRHHMDRYLARSTRYMPMMTEILRKNGLPEDLIYIALIESGFSPTAHSHANAVGYWQFIRGTGLRYGLHIDSLVDERRDFLLATEAAAGYYKTLYGLFGSWYLAIASYNTGENRVKRAVTRLHTRDFWELARRRALPRETVNYVPKYLAARMIGKDPKKYGFDSIEYQEPLTFEEITVSEPVNLKKLAEEMNLEHQDLLLLNPSFTKGFAPIYRGTEVTIRVPKGMTELAQNRMTQAIASAEDLASASRAGYVWYRIRRGDTLSTIARRFRTSVRQIRDINNMRGSRIIAGRSIKVPESGYRYAERQSSSGAVTNRTISVPASGEAGETLQYRIRRGDTLARIASRHGVKVSDIVQANNLRGSSRIYAGQSLLIPVRGTSVAGRAASSSGGDVSQFVTYLVQRGDTLIGIAQKFGTTVEALRAANNFGRRSILYAGQKIKVPQSGPSSQARVESRHVVRRGENLTLIAQKYGLSVRDLVNANGLRNSSRILVGQTLTIPGAIKHRVRRGETLSRIAQRYSVPQRQLAQANQIDNASHIQVGDTLIIPR